MALFRSVSHPFEDDWNERSRKEYRAMVEKCKACRLKSKCMGVYRSYLDLYGKEEFG